MIAVGDTVWVNGGTVHWVVERIESTVEPLGVVLRSGLTGRIRRESFGNLRPFNSKEGS